MSRRLSVMCSLPYRTDVRYICLSTRASGTFSGCIYTAIRYIIFCFCIFTSKSVVNRLLANFVAERAGAWIKLNVKTDCYTYVSSYSAHCISREVEETFKSIVPMPRSPRKLCCASKYTTDVCNTIVCRRSQWFIIILKRNTHQG